MKKVNEIKENPNCVAEIEIEIKRVEKPIKENKINKLQRVETN